MTADLWKMRWMTGVLYGLLLVIGISKVYSAEPPTLELDAAASSPTAGISSDRGASANMSTTSNIVFPNSPVSDVLAFYERLTGQRIIRDNNLNNLNVTVIAAEPMTMDEAAHFIESALLLNGVALLPAGSGVLKAVATATRKPGSEVVPLIFGAEKIPETDEVVSYFMPLHFINPEEAKKIFEAHVPLHDYGNITVAPGRSALLITENARLVKRFTQLQTLIDKEPVTVVSEFIQLHRADAKRVAEMVMEALKDGVEGSGNGGGSSVVVAGGAGGPTSLPNAVNREGVLYENRLVLGGLRLVPDDRTNRILAITRPSNLPLVRSLIAQFDAPTGTHGPRTRTLQYISAVEVMPTLIEILSKRVDGGGQAGNKAAMPGTSSNAGGNISTGGISASGRGGGGGRADQLSEPQGGSAPMAVTVGETWLIADPLANSILISGPPESVEEVNGILDRLDQRPKQVYLSTIIGQLTLGDGFEFGIDFLLKFNQFQAANGVNNGLAASFVTSSPTRRAVTLDPTTLLNPQSFTSLLTGLTIYGVLGDFIDHFISILETNNRFKVLSRPVVYTTNNKKAKIATGQQIPVPVSTLTQLVNTNNNNNAAVQANIDFKDVLLKLEVIPLINANGDVTLQIAQTNDSIVGSQEVSGNAIPIIGTQELNTTITVKNGQAVVLGGLVSESLRRDARGLPILSDLPYLGYLFRNTSRNTQRQELLIFIRPIVVDDPNTALEVTEMEKLRTNLSTDIESVSEFESKMIETRVRKAIPLGKPVPDEE